MNVPRRWVLAGLLVFLSLLVGRTFGTFAAVASGSALAVAAGLLWSRRTRTEQPRGTSEGGRRPDPADTRARRAFPRWVTWVVLTALFTATTAASIVWRLGSYQSETLNLAMVGVDSLAHAALLAAWVVWMLRVDRGHVSMLPLGMAVLMFAVAGGGGGLGVASQASLAMAGCVGFAIASQVILSRPPSRSAAAGVGWSSPDGRLPLLLSGLALSAILICTSLLTRATSEALPAVRQQFTQYLTDSLPTAASSRLMTNSTYVTGSRLGSVRAHMLGDSREVALRGYSDSVPGYLRGTVFTRYADRSWSNVDLRGRRISRQGLATRRLSPSGAGRVPVVGDHSGTLQRFRWRDDRGARTATVEIHGIPVKGSMAFTPLGTSWLEANAPSGIDLSEDEIVVSGVDIGEPYIAGVPQVPAEATLSAERERQMLWVPASLEPITRDFAQSLCGNRSSARGKADAVSDFFQQNFEYSLTGAPRVRGRDPIEQFLETRHAAHCEYFATATALILRSAGLPTRYVTGYVMVERSDEEDYFLARNRDAHAWVEAYDKANGRWFPVESTPGRRYRTLTVGLDDAEEDDLAADLDTSANLDAGSWYERLAEWLMTLRTGDALVILFRLAQFPLFCLLVLLLWIRFGRSSSRGRDPVDVKSLRMLGRVDRKLRRHALVRAPHETLHQFADRVETFSGSAPSPGTMQQLRSAAEWYRDYAAARYRGLEPPPPVM